ncbi:hypothetical protein SAMN05421762_3761 [Pseudooceanicola nitratireducens]|uniref:Glyoxalase/fosfomycin resistance/dioxygenase domain-containing protein n=2 Tax=Pseudooceanicola nitratireducens TaxID=517719 RepID=A0A1I1QSD4_9RHOB|nr:VOC family protein [Pseudooceanicola nitratireducens]SEJ76565.1 hypothetical protein SAMN05216183_10833 [Pseudooceanicola nitratireducens]SFD24945.1 hypothetical protein SAMN05421762_3761 [Pseudooceanicola nitratireducens]
MTSASKFRPMHNIFCEDVENQMQFYAAILGWNPIPEYFSPIYRVLQNGDFQLAFNGDPAYELLGLKGRKRRRRTPSSLINTMVTFMVDDWTTVDEIAAKVPELGGSIVQGPFATYYGQWQLVFNDPEFNVARITAMSLPEGVEIPVVTFD